MTPTALKNKEIETNASIADQDRKSREDIARKDRIVRGLTGVAGSTIGGSLGAAGRLGSALLKLGNDPDLYLALKNQAANVAEITTYINQGGEGPGSTFDVARQMSIQRAFYLPLFGKQYLNATKSQINKTFWTFYQKVYQDTGRNPTYSFADVAQPVISGMDLVILVEMMKRALATSCYTDRNFSGISESLTTACAFDYNDIRANFADYIEELGKLIKEVNTTITLPSDFALLKRRVLWAKHIIVDRSRGWITYYAMNQACFGVYNETTGTVDYTHNVNSSSSFANDMATIIWYGGTGPVYTANFRKALEYAWDMLDGLRHSSQINTIYGDVRKAVSDKIYQIEEFDRMKLAPLFVDHPSFGDQIRNANTFKFGATLATRLNASDDESALWNYFKQCNVRQDSNGDMYYGYANGEKIEFTAGTGTYYANSALPEFYLVTNKGIADTNLVGALTADTLLDLDDKNLNAGGLCEAVRFRPQALQGVVTASGGTTSAAAVLSTGNTELLITTHSIRALGHGSFKVDEGYNLHVSAGSSDTISINVGMIKLLSFGYHMIPKQFVYNAGILNCAPQAHNIIYVPTASQENISEMGTDSLFMLPLIQ